jgi:large subunit ribosomal protein L25
MKLKAEKRDIKGKQVKLLRTEGDAPASIYGPKRKSVSITINQKEFFKVFDKVGFNKIFDLDIEGEAKTSKVLVKDIQQHPTKDYIYDVSFYQIDEDSKITVEVPVEIVGEAPAVKLNLGFLVTPLESVALYCFPKDIPNSIVVDISTLENPGESIALNTIDLGEDVALDSSVDPSIVLASIAAPQKEEEVVAETEEGAESVEGEEGAEATGETTEESGDSK